MKYMFLILVSLLLGCGKKEKKPATSNNNPPAATTPTPSYTVEISAKPFCGSGILRIQWDCDTSVTWQDSIYQYNGPVETRFTKVITADSIRISATAKACGSCQVCNSYLLVKVNGSTAKETSATKGEYIYVRTH